MKKTALTKTFLKIYGVNKNKILLTHKIFGVNTRISQNFKSQTPASKIKNFFNNQEIFGKLFKNNVRKIISFEENIKTFRGLRNKYNYPARGQRTHTNGKTKKKQKKI